MHYDLGYIDLEQQTLQPVGNPFGARLSPMSQGRTVTVVFGSHDDGGILPAPGLQARRFESHSQGAQAPCSSPPKKTPACAGDSFGGRVSSTLRGVRPANRESCPHSCPRMLLA